MSEKVIIVGNSPSILSQKLGEIVDAHDVVIRINRCVTKGYEKHIGKKINIWATTSNENLNNFIPDGYNKLDHIWVRTWRLLSDKHTRVSQNLNLPKEPEIPKYVMYKTPQFKKNAYFQDLIKGLKHEPCTGLLTILTSTLFYKDINLLGFTFYTEQKNEDAFGYYRSSELNAGGKHAEDSLWQENKDSGFASEEEGARRQKVLKNLINDGAVKMLNPKELGGIKL